jgi:hypothetical protein
MIKKIQTVKQERNGADIRSDMDLNKIAQLLYKSVRVSVKFDDPSHIQVKHIADDRVAKPTVHYPPPHANSMTNSFQI